MYNVKGPSKIVAKTTRRGISQNMDNNIRDYSRNRISSSECGADNEPTNSNGPKPTFHKKTQPSPNRQQIISPQHEEIINFINESWNAACSEIYQHSNGNSSSSGSCQSAINNNNNNGDSNTRSEENRHHNSILYYQDEPCICLQNFKPFDLESWWGKRLYALVTGSVNAKN